MDIIDIVKVVNTVLTPFSLVVSVIVAYYSLKAFRSIKRRQQLPVASSLVGVGMLFSSFSIISLAIYSLSMLTNSGLGHDLSSWRSLITNVMIQIISIIMIRIYRDKI